MNLRNAHVLGFVVMFVVTGGIGVTAASAQSLDQRIADYRRKATDRTERQQAMEARARAQMVLKLQSVVESVDIQQSPLRGVLAWYRDVTGVPLVVNWRALEQAGVDPDQEITIQVKRITSGQLLALIMQMASVDVDQSVPGDALIYEVTPWYLRIMTKSQANKHPVTRIYNVLDLVMSIPDFKGPNFDLNSVLSGGIGEEAASIFEEAEGQGASESDLRQERGDQLAQLIADSIEPTIWQRNGGEFCSIRYHRGMLIVRAPQYVQKQIGRPTVVVPSSAKPVE